MMQASGHRAAAHLRSARFEELAQNRARREAVADTRNGGVYRTPCASKDRALRTVDLAARNEGRKESKMKRDQRL